ncbi:site-specific integrase [Gordonia aichiensis]|uniref:site-specific integrase n=1 Tax=Gordonia aichiensis TaxID=36820 RepID=UPI0032669E77
MTDRKPGLPLVAVPSASSEPATVSDTSRLRLREALSDVLAPASKRAYTRHWAAFEQYCAVKNYRSLPADVDVVCEYLLMLEHSTPTTRTRGEGTYSVSYIDQALAAIRYVHRSTAAMPIDSKALPLWLQPQLAEFMRAMRNRAAAAGRSDVEQEAPLLLEQLDAMLETGRDDADTWRKHLHLRRDSALLLMGWSGAMRRSEPVALRVSDVKHRFGKWTITLRRSKTDQGGKGQIKALPKWSSAITCPPCAYLRWMEAVHVYDSDGRPGLIRLLARDKPLTQHICAHPPELAKPLTPVFRSITRTGDIATIAMSDQLVHTIVRRRLQAAYPDLDITEYGAHSLRAGFTTQSLIQGIEPRAIMRQTGHRTLEGVLIYARERDAHDNNAATMLGL